MAEKSGDSLFNAAVLIDNHGNILLKHRKIKTLDELMSPPYSRGNSVSIVETSFGRIGILICADTFDPEILETMGRQDPDMLLVPFGWAAPENQWPGHGKSLEATVINAAESTGATVVGTDPVGEVGYGPWKGMVFGGQSVTVSAKGELLAKGKDRDIDMVMVKVSF